jgi:hypothetical protein
MHDKAIESNDLRTRKKELWRIDVASFGSSCIRAEAESANAEINKTTSKTRKVRDKWECMNMENEGTRV